MRSLRAKYTTRQTNLLVFMHICIKARIGGRSSCNYLFQRLYYCSFLVTNPILNINEQVRRNPSQRISPMGNAEVGYLIRGLLPYDERQRKLPKVYRDDVRQLGIKSSEGRAPMIIGYGPSDRCWCMRFG